MFTNISQCILISRNIFCGSKFLSFQHYCQKLLTILHACTLNYSFFPGSDFSGSQRVTPSLQMVSTPTKRPLSSELLFSPSSESGSNSEVNSQPASLTDSMALVNKILADGNLDRVERIEKLEAILTDVTSMALGSRSSSSHNINGGLNTPQAGTGKVDAETQTISTGDISITKVYSPSKTLPLKEGSQI